MYYKYGSQLNGHHCDYNHIPDDQGIQLNNGHDNRNGYNGFDDIPNNRRGKNSLT